MDREHYFKINPTLMKAMDRDQSWIINKAIGLGLVALGADPKRLMSESEEVRAVVEAQATVIREQSARLDPKDREGLVPVAGGKS